MNEEYLRSIEALLQREDDFLLYTPDQAFEDRPPSARPGLSYYFILDGHSPRPVDDLFTWGRWYERADCTVTNTQVTPDVEVSTVFLGVDPNFSGVGAPLLFKTVIIGFPGEGYQDRYSTWEEAEAGHARAVLCCQKKLKEDAA